MAREKRSSKRKRGKAALVLGAAGVSMAMTGGASATAPSTNAPSQDNARQMILAEEEISDVSLATFHVFDKESESPLRQGIRLAAGRGCGGGGGCGGCGGGGGCARGGVGGCAHGGGGGCAGRGCRGCGGRGCGCAGGCACGGVWIGGACLGCGGCSGTCWQWDPYLGQWIFVCY